jgi:WD40 repeat protein
VVRFSAYFLDTRTEELFMDWKMLRAMALLTAVVLAACASKGGQPAKPVYKLENQQAGTTALAVSADSRMLATGGWSGRVVIRNLQDSRKLGGFQAHTGEIIGLEFLRDGILLSGGREGSVKKWSLGGRLLWESKLPTGLSAMTLAHGSGRMATASHDGEIILWDVSIGEIVDRWTAHDSRIRAVAYAGEADLLASSDTDRTVKLWDSSSGDLLWESHIPTDSRDLVFSGDGQWLYGGGWFDLFKWNVATGELQVIDTDHHGIINNLALIDSTGALASVSRQTDSAVLIIDPKSGRTLKNFGSHGLCGERVTVSPDEKYLISNSDDYSISVWELGSAPQ